MRPGLLLGTLVTLALVASAFLVGAEVSAARRAHAAWLEAWLERARSVDAARADLPPDLDGYRIDVSGRRARVRVNELSGDVVCTPRGPQLAELRFQFQEGRLVELVSLHPRTGKRVTRRFEGERPARVRIHDRSGRPLRDCSYTAGRLTHQTRWDYTPGEPWGGTCWSSGGRLDETFHDGVLQVATATAHDGRTKEIRRRIDDGYEVVEFDGEGAEVRRYGEPPR